MEIFPEFMQRLLKIQSALRQRSPELILEDERLMDGLQKRILRYICHLLSLMRMHSPDCEHCNAGKRCSDENIRKRLEELLRYRKRLGSTLLLTRSPCPRRFRSRLATIRELKPRTGFALISVPHPRLAESRRPCKSERRFQPIRRA